MIFLLINKQIFNKMRYGGKNNTNNLLLVDEGSLGMVTIRSNISALLWKPLKVGSEQFIPLEVAASLKAKRAKFSDQAFSDRPRATTADSEGMVNVCRGQFSKSPSANELTCF